MLTQWSLQLLLRKIFAHVVLCIVHFFMHICSFCLIFVLFDQNGTLPQTEDVLKEMLCLISQKSLFIDSVYMCTFHHWKLRSGASCALVCVAAHLVCIQLTLLRMWSVWCLFLFCHGLMLTDRSLSLSLSLPLTLSLSLCFSISLSPSFSHSLFACYAALSRAESEAKPRRAGHLCKCAWIISSQFFSVSTPLSQALIIIHPSSFTDPPYANLASPL